MQRMLGLGRGRAWVFERPAAGRVLGVEEGTRKNLSFHPAGAIVATNLKAAMLIRETKKAGALTGRR